MKKKVKVLYIFPSNRSSLLKKVANGDSPDNTLYGYNYLKKDFDVAIGDCNPLIEKIINTCFCPLTILMNSDFTRLNIARPLLLVRKINQVDVVVTCVDSISKAYLLLKQLKIIHTPSISMAGNVMDGTEKIPIIHRWLWKDARRIITHAEVDQQKLKIFGLERKGLMIPVGSDKRFYNMNNNRQSNRLIVSVGSDRDRDFQLLVNVAKKFPRITFRIFTKKSTFVSREFINRHWNNVIVMVDVTEQETRKWMSQAKASIIPLKETNRACGQLALQDSLLMGIPTIITRVRGIVTAYPLRDKIEVMFVEESDAVSLKHAITEITENDNLSKKLSRKGRTIGLRYTTRNYGKSIKIEINKIVNKSKETSG